MIYVMLYTDSDGQQRESMPGSMEELIRLFYDSDARSGTIYNRRSLQMFHAGIRKYAPVEIARL